MPDQSPLDGADGDVSEADIAQALGFSSFGGPPKKRKYTAHLDHAVTASSTAPSSRQATTGANSMALGQQRAPRPSSGLPLHPRQDEDGAQKNADEIDLADEDPEPPYIDTSRSPRRLEEEALEVQGQSGAIAGDSWGGGAHGQAPGAGDAASPSAGHAGSQGRGRGGRGGYGAGRHERNPGQPWWQGYFDPSFNENPWDSLEKSKGLEPRGAWVSRSSGAAKSG